MALYPCSVDGHRYAGPQRTLYVSAFGQIANYRRKARLCKVHFDQAEERARAAWTALDDDCDPGNHCSYDSEPRAITITLTFYDQHAPERVYYLDACVGCAEALQTLAPIGISRPFAGPSDNGNAA